MLYFSIADRKKLNICPIGNEKVLYWVLREKYMNYSATIVWISPFASLSRNDIIKSSQNKIYKIKYRFE